MLAASYWQSSNGNAGQAHNLQVAGGAFTFVTIIFGWWIFIAIMLASIDFPIVLPGKHAPAPPVLQAVMIYKTNDILVGDLSNVIKGASQRESKV